MERTSDNYTSGDILQRLDFLDIDDPLDRLLVLRDLAFRGRSSVVAILKETATGVEVEIERVS